FFIRYFEMLLPIEPRSYRMILGRRLDALKGALSPDGDEIRELESILTALEHLPPPTRTDEASVAERQREKEVIKKRIRQAVEQSSSVAQFIEQNVQELNGAPNDPHSFDALDELLDAQVYRLCHWKAAADEINYRRFFDINDLAAVCTEDPKVFAESHRVIFELLAGGDVDGLRVDHIDGLFDPLEYLNRLQSGDLRTLAKAAYEAERGGHDTKGEEQRSEPSWDDIESDVLQRLGADRPRQLYVIVEKVLGFDEPLPTAWPIAGATGYEFLGALNGLFVDPAGLDELVRFYGRFTEQRMTFPEAAHEAKTLILKTSMASGLQLLAQQLSRLAGRRRRFRDFTLNSLRAALRDVIACFPVYRTYIRRGDVSDRDRQVVCRAVAEAKHRNQASNAAVFDFIRDVLLLSSAEETDERGRREEEQFAGRFQQLTSPVIAKGIEDTAFYRWFPLASLCEVGSDPAHGVTTIEAFHRDNQRRQRQWPRSLLASTTHDTKRTEDVRARLNVLCEIPRVWRAAVNRWARWNRRHRRDVDGEPAPSRNDEYLFYHNLLGIWPVAPPDAESLEQLTGRMQTYMEKAIHEAKAHTSWVNPNAEYEAAVRAFVAAALDARPKSRNRFLADFRAFHDQVVNWGLYNALSQTLLKLTAPGVPDLYQGQELWDFSLVDPDNRRPVDFAMRRELLGRLTQQAAAGSESLLALARELGRNPRDPRTKLFLTWRALHFWRQQKTPFDAWRYLPLEPEGAKAEHVCAFARRSGEDGPTAMVVAPRWFARLTPIAEPPFGGAIWQDTRLPTGQFHATTWQSALTGRTHSAADGFLSVGDLLAEFPVALISTPGAR
ncbi:MAG: malto-oligosyltrehalose synthase, partial [Thermoguttaceae bacterium]